MLKVITAGHLEFEFHYTHSWLSFKASQLLSFVTNPWPLPRALRYALSLMASSTGVAFAVVDKLLDRLMSTKPAPYLTPTCSSMTVIAKLPKNVRDGIVRPSLSLASFERFDELVLRRQADGLDLFRNMNPKFSKWITEIGALKDPFVVIDVGVLGGESPRWDVFGDHHLVVHGFDPIEEVIDELRTAKAHLKNRTYHAMAIGNENGERSFFFNRFQPTKSSLIESSDHGVQRRLVSMRSLDALLKAHIIRQADFLKVDVEGFEPEVLLGARDLLARGVLGIEIETNFNISAAAPKSHFGAVYNLVLEHGLRLFDLNFERSVRPSYLSVCANGSTVGVGTPSTFNVLFCRDPVAERDNNQFYERMPTPLTVQQILKLIAIYELHGLNDAAVDTALTFSKQLEEQIDVERAIELLCN
jgi:FkbM family methyltransferase